MNNISVSVRPKITKVAAIMMLLTAVINVIDADRALEKLYRDIASPHPFQIGFLLFAIGGICLVLGFLLTGMTVLSDNLNPYTRKTSIFIAVGYFVIVLAEIFHSWFFTLPTVIIEAVVATIILLHLGSKYKNRTEKKKRKLIVLTEILMIISVILAIISEPDVVSQFVGGNVIFMIVEFTALILFEMYMCERY